MIRVHGNIMVKNEALLLDSLLPIWKEYPLEKFVFYNDNSTDDTVGIINKHLGDRAIIINDNLDKFHESHNRSRMLEHSRKEEATHVIAFDCDELLSQNFVDNFKNILPIYENTDLYLYWYNVVNGTLEQTRNDPQYAQNYRSFVLPLKNTGEFDLTQWKYHTPRTPPISLPKAATKEIGVIHLQSINRRFYALKQLWYKHYEMVNYNHSIELINQRYDSVVNKLNFEEVTTPAEIVGNLNFDSKIYDEIEKEKKYKDYILRYYNEQLVTFGKEYL
jgi:hypothetical protein